MLERGASCNRKWKARKMINGKLQLFTNAEGRMFPDSGMQQYFCRSRFATFLFLQGGGTATDILTSSRVRIATKWSLARNRNPAKGSFSRVGIATISMYISPDSELRQEYFSSRVRIAIIMILDQIQEYSKVFVFQIRDCNKLFNPPESVLP